MVQNVSKSSSVQVVDEPMFTDELENGLKGHEAEVVLQGTCQRCMATALCVVLTLYFLPMLSFIPLALSGGLKLPNPYSATYNNRSISLAEAQHEEANAAPPTGPWFWDLGTVVFLVFGFPFVLLGGAYLLKTRAFPQGPMIDESDLHDS
mmetsp:Transcript_19968/g.46470  ORF Transcript_19968/g.46470 Transcript_19968/m.46470 type:complete len:150 (-) Transcript_19968:225-674(-)